MVSSFDGVWIFGSYLMVTLRLYRVHFSQLFAIHFDHFLSECEGEGLRTDFKELDLERSVLYSPLLPDELIETRFPNLSRAVRGGIGDPGLRAYALL